MYKNANILLKYLQRMVKHIKFVSSNQPKSSKRSLKIYCWVVKFLADTPPCPGGGEYGKPKSG